jgi:hypothetical protein
MFEHFKKFTMMEETNSVTTDSTGNNAMLGEGWFDANVHFPDELETVFISNGKGWTSIGCRVYDRECGWHWAESNGVVYEEKGKIVAECESDDLDVKYWHKLPKPPFA